MLVWLLAFPLETTAALRAREARARIFWRVVYILMAAASSCLLFHFVSASTALTAVRVADSRSLAAFLRFVLVWIGSLFSVGAPAICGAVVLFLFGGLAAAAIWQMRRTGAWRSHYPWLVLGCYTVISGCVVAMGRLGFDYSMAGDARYTAFSVFLYIAVLGLGFSVYTQAKARPLSLRELRFQLPSFPSWFILTFWAITFKKERRLLRILTPAREHSLLVLRWSEAIPQNPEIALLSPYPLWETVSTIRTLAEHDALRPRLVSQRLASAVNERPEHQRHIGGDVGRSKPRRNQPSGIPGMGARARSGSPRGLRCSRLRDVRWRVEAVLRGRNGRETARRGPAFWKRCAGPRGILRQGRCDQPPTRRYHDESVGHRPSERTCVSDGRPDKASATALINAA